MQCAIYLRVEGIKHKELRGKGIKYKLKLFLLFGGYISFGFLSL